MSRLVRVCNKKDVSPGQIRRIEMGDESIAVCWIAGQYFAVSGTCTHQDWPLYEGYMVDAHIICPLHGSEFDLQTGKCLKLPATAPLKTYRVVNMGEELYIEMAQTNDDTQP